jgi:lipopolysaccharide/colanic/teichoic acid biosynthesis glycosyltransferase
MFIIKRFSDILSSIFGLIILIPVLICICIAIKICMPGDIFFIQKRIGKKGTIFKMIKFRTMSFSENNSSISVAGESRITPLGAFLRKNKFDELPELWNVLKGDMSMVGPRPDVPGYADKLQGEDRIILSVRPGITGPASIKYSNEEELLSKVDEPIKYNDEVLYPNKVRINKNYIKHSSFWLDIKIIIYTIIGKKLNDSRFN